MTLPTTVEPLPASYSFGKVVGRIIHLIADTADDADDRPEARPAAGKVRFTPDKVLTKTVEADYPAIVLNASVVATIDAEGYIQDAEGNPSIWLAVGVYTVTFEITGAPGAVEPFPIAVTSDHTDATPLDLAAVVPYVPPTGVVVQTILIPAGGTDGQMLVRQADGGLRWQTVLLADGSNLNIDSTDLSDSTTVGRALVTAVDAAAGRTAIGAVSEAEAEAVGTDLYTPNTLMRRDASGWTQAHGLYGMDDFNEDDPSQAGNATPIVVAKRMVAGANSYADQAAADAVAGFDPTVQAADITDSTATGRAVITAASQAAARTAIGAGTSSLAVGTAATDAKAGNYQPTAANISDSTATGRSVLKAADAAAARTAIGAGKVDSSDSTILNIVKLTQTQYNALATKVATTLYVIQG